MSDHDPKDMLKTASEAENIGEMDEENGDDRGSRTRGEQTV